MKDFPLPPPLPATRTFQFGDGAGGVVGCDATDGSVRTVRYPAMHAEMNFLLGDAEWEWHEPPYFWGKGLVMAAGGEAGRWDAPSDGPQWFSDGLLARFEPLPGLRLTVERRFGSAWTEDYVFTNHRSVPLILHGLGVSVPFRDVYASARESLSGACHAHLWPGGSFAYAWAVRMDGVGPGLGLVLRSGQLWSYAVESRHHFLNSNVRGHLFLHVTDRARAPESFGGQPEIVLEPGGSYRLAWEIGWHADFAAFERTAQRTPFTLPRLSAPVGGRLAVETRLALETPPDLRVATATNPAGTAEVSSDLPGVHHLDLRGADGYRARVAVQFHLPLRELTERRVAGILRWHRARGRDAPRAGAFLPVDTRTGLAVLGGGWNDWSDGRERIGMARLLQETRRLGWGDPAALDAAIDGFAAYATAHLLAADGSVLEDSYHPNPRRLYNYPWLLEFFLAEHARRGQAADLERAAGILESYLARGGREFLGFLHGAGGLLDALRAAGQGERAGRLRAAWFDQAGYFIMLGHDLPAHEVNYEQSIVAPLLLLLLGAADLAAADGDGPEATRYRAEARRLLPWLEAFAGEQPHVRLRHVPIRHWDGFWFGLRRQWGDVFPHYWSVLSAAVFADLARAGEPGAARLADRAREIFAANLVNFFPDGSATCAFVFPSAVDHQPAHAPDPLANDQDWALVWLLRYPELWPET